MVYDLQMNVSSWTRWLQQILSLFKRNLFTCFFIINLFTVVHNLWLHTCVFYEVHVFFLTNLASVSVRSQTPPGIWADILRGRSHQALTALCRNPKGHVWPWNMEVWKNRGTITSLSPQQHVRELFEKKSSTFVVILSLYHSLTFLDDRSSRHKSLCNYFFQI